jgi:hypothetical protein
METDVADLFVALTISKQPVLIAGSIIVSASREGVFGWCPYIVNGPTRSTQTMIQGIQCQILLFWVGAAHIPCVIDPSLSFDILDNWNINNHCSTTSSQAMSWYLFLIVSQSFSSI